MSLNDFEDKELKSECTRLVQLDGMYKCMVMVGPPPLIAEMFDTWDSTYDAYCERCVRFLHSDSVIRDWLPILKERERLWTVKMERWMSEERKRRGDESRRTR